jgi:hypothetical protein
MLFVTANRRNLIGEKHAQDDHDGLGWPAVETVSDEGDEASCGAEEDLALLIWLASARRCRQWRERRG